MFREAGADYWARLDGAGGCVWEPLWQLETRRLWSRPDTLSVRRLASESGPAGAYLASLRQLYLAAPLADGRPVTTESIISSGNKKKSAE